MPQPRNDSNAPDFGLLVNRAAIEIIKPERGSGRDRLAPPAQRLHDMFRVLHARRRGVTDLEAIAAEADLGVQGSTWMEAITSGHPSPTSSCLCADHPSTSPGCSDSTPRSDARPRAARRVRSVSASTRTRPATSAIA